jgi:hypothetical protein
MESDEALSHLDSRTFYTMLIAIFSVSALLAGRCLVNQVFTSTRTARWWNSYPISWCYNGFALEPTCRACSDVGYTESTPISVGQQCHNTWYRNTHGSISICSKADFNTVFYFDVLCNIDCKYENPNRQIMRGRSTQGTNTGNTGVRIGVHRKYECTTIWTCRVFQFSTQWEHVYTHFHRLLPWIR